MTINSPTKVTMNAVNGASVVPASQGARSATEDAGAAVDSSMPPGNDGEVVAVARRRQFSNADKRRILLAADRCTKPCRTVGDTRRVCPSLCPTRVAKFL